MKSREDKKNIPAEKQTDKTEFILDSREFEAVAAKVSLVSIAGNLILSLFKAIAGILAHSGAMISDALHSASDVFSSFIVMIGVRISTKESDSSHPYGHDRFECVAAIVLSVVLFMTGLMIGNNALRNIVGYINGTRRDLAVPGVLALIAAIVSIAAKEAMFRYTMYYANRCDSSALRANAWHHRSDALSSIGALIGIAGARMGWPVLDPAASLVIFLFIVKAAYDIFMEAVEKMVDHACSAEIEEAMRRCALSQKGVLGIDMLQTREFGSRVYVDMEICADGSLTLSESHRIAEHVHDAIEKEFPKVKHIMVHVNPKE